ncbi:MAG: tetratricopeptide repeat protein [Cyclobacteriaceae bacterium]|nr:tetratricopeptide repeat protein [Cyclobacteriaceae bacterium]
MLRNRIILILVGVALIIFLFNLPMVAVENEKQLAASDSVLQGASDPHAESPVTVQKAISRIRGQYLISGSGEKSAIFADSLSDLYWEAGKFDSAGWYADKAAAFFNTMESWIKAGDSYYQAYTFALDQLKQNELAEKAQGYFKRVLNADPGNLEVKTKLAMTYLSSSSPMQGITLLREVLAEDPKNESALFNMGMLSIQSGQYDRAIERLTELTSINPGHIQAQLLLGVAYANKGDNKLAREQFEKVKKLDTDPAVQATADSYLKDLK